MKTMNWELNGQSADVEQALAGGVPQQAGWFRFYFSRPAVGMVRTGPANTRV